MASSTSLNGQNSGLQVVQNHGHITAQFLQSETSLNQACLRDLRATNPYDDKERIKDTNGGLLRDSYRWILDNKEFKQWQSSQGERLLWIRGDPGKGKTMLLCGIIEELTRMDRYNTATISFFFCQATDIRINNATAVLRGLIYSIVIKRPSLLAHVRSRYDQAGKPLFEDINAWVALSAIFTDILEDPALESAYMVIDALDECIHGLSSLLDLIVQGSSIHSNVKWIVSSRNWPEIIERLDSTQVSPISLELNEAYISEAVNEFIQHKVDDLAKNKHYSDETRDAVNNYLLSNSQGTFLWAALVCRELSKTLRWNTLRKLEVFPPGLDALYGRMIDRVLDSENADICIEVLALISIVYRPITMDELCMMIEIPSMIAHDHEALSGIIAMCGSFLTQRQDTVTFIHQSAKDFLLQEAPNKVFPGGIEAKHHMIFTRLLSSLFQTLRRDIYNIKAPGFPATKVEKPSPDPLRTTGYACVYWIEHLQASEYDQTADPSLSEGGYIGGFLQHKYLQWLEALSILGSIPHGTRAMQKLEVLIQEKSESLVLLHRARDASRFIQYHRTAIESSPLQVYYSPLIFSPRDSLTKMCYQHERPSWVLNDSILVEDWSLCLQTFEGHSLNISEIVWSPCGSRLASVCYNDTIRIWDPVTGQTILILELPFFGGLLCSIAWSPDARQLASTSDNIISIWDLATGHIISILKHTDPNYKIVWSPDGSRLASTSKDTIKICDLATGQIILVLESLDNSNNNGCSIAWSPDASRLASASHDTIKIWDPSTGKTILNSKHNRSLPLVAWSPDGSRLASTCFDMSIKIWDPATSQTTLILEHTDMVSALTWSPDGSRLASASGKTVNIWDVTTSQRMTNLEEDINRVTLIAWSEDGSRVASASDDKTIRIWNPATGQTILIIGPTDTTHKISFSPDGSRLVSASFGSNIIMVWDLATGQRTSTLNPRDVPARASSLIWSPDGSQLAIVFYDRRVTIWNTATGQKVSTFFFEEHTKLINSIAWSQDGSRLASACYDTGIIWDAATGQAVTVLEEHSGATSLAWSPDGCRLASAYYDTVKIWDPASGRCASTLLISSPQFLKFNRVDSNQLHTGTGTIDLSSVDSFTVVSDLPTLPDQRGYGLNRDKSWITYNGVNLLWLPAEYRFAYFYPSSTLPAKLVIGCSTGRCIFFMLADPGAE